MAKTILITGTSTGIGYGAAKAFTAAGYRVIATIRKAEDAERLKHELGENLHPVLCDVTHPEQVATLPEQVKRISENGWLDGLINNSGIELVAPAELQNMEEIRAHFETNVFGLIAVTKALLPLLGTDAKAQGHTGRIINISSIGGVLALPFSFGLCGLQTCGGRLFTQPAPRAAPGRYQGDHPWPRRDQIRNLE